MGDRAKTPGGTNFSRRKLTAPLAVLLQCIPLVGAASCAINAASGQRALDLPGLLWWSVLFWGVGYAVLHRWSRWVLVGLLGPVVSIGACFASFNGVNADYEHGSVDAVSAGWASLATALVVSAGVLLTAVDAYRLAATGSDGVRTVTPENTLAPNPAREFVRAVLARDPAASWGDVLNRWRIEYGAGPEGSAASQLAAAYMEEATRHRGD